jgi:predicted aldo/keto reductase-like oxidoreductase
MTFGNGEGRFKLVAGVDQAGADALVERSLAAGINFFDTGIRTAELSCCTLQLDSERWLCVPKTPSVLIA